MLTSPAQQTGTRAGGGDKGVSRWRCLFLGCLCALKSSSAEASCSLVAALSSGSTHARSRRRWVGLGRPTHPLRALEARCCRCSDLCAACCASRDAGGGRGRQGGKGGARRGPGRGELRVALVVVGDAGIGAWHGLSSTPSATSTTSSPISSAAPHTSATVKSTLSSPPPPPAAAATAADAAAPAASSSPSLPAAFAAKCCCCCCVCCCCCCVCCMSLSLSPTCASSTAKREAAD